MLPECCGESVTNQANAEYGGDTLAVQTPLYAYGSRLER